VSFSRLIPARVQTRGAALLAAVLASACATAKTVATTPTEPSSRDYYPLKVGATWTYAVIYPGQKGEMTVKITGEKDGYFVDNRQAGLRHTTEGLRDQDRYLIRNPLKPGNAWKAVVSASAVEHYKILSVGEKCDCPAGQFDDCLVVETSIRKDAKVTLVNQWTFAKDVGLVKLEMAAQIDGKQVPQVRQELVKFALGGSETKASDQDPKAPQNEGDAPGWEH
jgi:hypothetical protein